MIENLIVLFCIPRYCLILERNDLLVASIKPTRCTGVKM